MTKNDQDAWVMEMSRLIPWMPVGDVGFGLNALNRGTTSTRFTSTTPMSRVERVRIWLGSRVQRLGRRIAGGEY